MKRVQLSWANIASYDEDGVEGRRAGRVACEALQCDNGKVLDLSRTGARLRIRSWSSPRKGQKRGLVLQTCDGARVGFPCRVAWFRRVVWGVYEVGVEFVGLTPDQQSQLSTIATMHADRTWIHAGRGKAA